MGSDSGWKSKFSPQVFTFFTILILPNTQSIRNSSMKMQEKKKVDRDPPRSLSSLSTLAHLSKAKRTLMPHLTISKSYAQPKCVWDWAHYGFRSRSSLRTPCNPQSQPNPLRPSVLQSVLLPAGFSQHPLFLFVYLSNDCPFSGFVSSLRLQGFQNRSQQNKTNFNIILFIYHLTYYLLPT